MSLSTQALLKTGESMTDPKTNYNRETGEFYNLVPNKNAPKMSFSETLKIMRKVFLEGGKRTPKQKLPEVKPDLKSFLEPGEKVKFIWFGHSTLLLNIEGKIVLIDPVFSGAASPFSFMVKRFQPPVLSLKELPHIDVILISHDHYDHLDRKTIEFFTDKDTAFIAPVGVGDHLYDWGIPRKRITELQWGDAISHNGIKFIATPAQHFSGRGLFDRNETLWASFVIESHTEKIYYSGDSGYGDHFKEIGKRYGPFDLAFLENGQYNERWPDVHMQPEETLQAQIDLDAKYLMPIHWGMFDLSLHNWKEPIERTYKIARNWHIPIYTPRLGEIVDTNRPVKNTPWWINLETTKETQNEKNITYPAIHPEFTSPRK